MDETETVTLRYPGCLCTLSASLAVNLPERAILHGTKGTLYMPKPHFSGEYTLTLYDGTVQTWRDEVTENGFVYEAQEVIRCVKAGLLESPVVPHELTLRCARIFDIINAKED